MFRFYEAHRVEEFYLYDPGRGDLAGWLCMDMRLEEIVEMNGYESPRLKFRFDPGEGMDSL